MRFSGIVVSVVAATGGALLIKSDRSVLTSGTMFGLSPIPSAGLISLGLVSLDFSLALQAIVQFVIDSASYCWRHLEFSAGRE